MSPKLVIVLVAAGLVVMGGALGGVVVWATGGTPEPAPAAAAPATPQVAAPATPATAAQTLYEDPPGICRSKVYPGDTSVERSFMCALRYRGNRTVAMNTEQQLVNGGQYNCQQIRTRGVAVIPGLVAGLVGVGYTQQESQDVVTISINHFCEEFQLGSTVVNPASAPAQETAAAPPTYPLASFGAGTYLVGSEVAPGNYVTEGADWCYWERAKNTDGGLGAILANGNAQGHTNVTVKSSDKAFKVTGNCTFTKR
jgi:hypothetical protein